METNITNKKKPKNNVEVIDDTKTKVKGGKKKIQTKQKKKTEPEVVVPGLEAEPAEKEQVDAPIDEYDEEDSFGDNKNEIEDEDKDDKDEEDDAEDEAEPGAPTVDGEGEADAEGEGDGEGDGCIYNYADNRSDDDGQEIVFDDDGLEIISEVIPPDQRRTKPILFKYERVRLLGDRAQQLTLGAKPMIKNVEGLLPKEIAELEIEKNVIPLIIQRPLPNGKKERWHISELKH